MNYKKEIESCECHIEIGLSEKQQTKIGINPSDVSHIRTTSHKVLRIISAYRKLLHEYSKILKEDKIETFEAAENATGTQDKYKQNLYKYDILIDEAWPEIKYEICFGMCEYGLAWHLYTPAYDHILRFDNSIKNFKKIGNTVKNPEIMKKHNKEWRRKNEMHSN